MSLDSLLENLHCLDRHLDGKGADREDDIQMPYLSLNRVELSSIDPVFHARRAIHIKLARSLYSRYQMLSPYAVELGKGQPVGLE